jgi:hypothetical protein
LQSAAGENLLEVVLLYKVVEAQNPELLRSLQEALALQPQPLPLVPDGYRQAGGVKVNSYFRGARQGGDKLQIRVDAVVVSDSREPVEATKLELGDRHVKLGVGGGLQDGHEPVDVWHTCDPELNGGHVVQCNGTVAL